MIWLFTRATISSTTVSAKRKAGNKMKMNRTTTEESFLRIRQTPKSRLEPTCSSKIVTRGSQRAPGCPGRLERLSLRLLQAGRALVGTNYREGSHIVVGGRRAHSAVRRPGFRRKSRGRCRKQSFEDTLWPARCRIHHFAV